MNPDVQQKLLSCFKAFVNRDYQQTAALGQELVSQAPTLVVIQLLFISLQRLGRQSEVDVLGPLLAGALRSASWERLLLELTLGLAPAPDVAAQARTAEQRCQAHFYTGAKMVTEGRMDEAREAFDACLETGIEGVESMLAKVERVSPPPPSALQAAAKKPRPAVSPAVVPRTLAGAEPLTSAQVSEVEAVMPETPRVAGAFFVKRPASASPPPAETADIAARDPRRLNELAIELFTQGRYRDALPFAARAVELQREGGDEDSGDYAAVVANLAGIYQALGQYQAAEPLFRRALELRRAHAHGRMDNPYFGGFTAGPLGRCLSETAHLFKDMGRFGEAESLLQEAIDINRTALGESHPSFAATVMSLAEVHMLMGKYDSADALYRQAIDTKRQSLGEKSPSFAASLAGHATLHTATGNYENARALLRQAIEIEKAARGDEAPVTVNALAAVSRLMGDYAVAEQQLLRALDLRRKAGSESHPEYAMVLNNLGELYRIMGRYPEALRVWNQALELKRQTLGEDHPSFALALNNLAELYRLMGDDASAEPFFRRALDIFLRTLGENHANYATMLNNLGALYAANGQIDAALSHFQQALEIRARVLGDRHPLTATGHNNLGRILESLDRWTEAEAHLELAVDGLGHAVGEQHADYATALCGLAHLRRLTGRGTEVETMLRRALTITQAALGGDHPQVAHATVELAIACVIAGRLDEALALNQEAATITDRLIGQVFTMGSERQRMGFLATLHARFDVFLSLVSRHLPDRPAAVDAAFDLVLRRKAIAAEVLAAQREAVLGGRYPDLAAPLSELGALRMRIAQKSLAGPGPEGLKAHRKQLADWNAERDRLEVVLARDVPEMNLERKLRTVDRQVVALALPDETALVEFVRYGVYDFHAVPARGGREWQPARYVAFVLLAGQPESGRMIDLGEAEPIDRMIATFRTSTTGEHDARAARDLGAAPMAEPSAARSSADGSDVRANVFDPLVVALSGRTRLFLAPDGDLTRLSFEALPFPDGRRLIDDYSISYLGAGRDVVRFAAPSTIGAGPCVVVADPDFDLGRAPDVTRPLMPDEPRRSRDFDRASIEFRRLPGTRVEGDHIAAMLGVQPWVDAAALEARLKACTSPRILHLATHGFFLANQPAAGEAGHRGLGALGAPEASTFSAPGFGLELENPLLRSGIALSGANTWCRGGTPPEGAEDGILTAEDVAGLNLAGTEMVVLSACETGLGEVRTGEGVFGLRRAFVLAGARTMVMSLWKVPDQQTQELMEDFYRRVLRGQPRADALREAQLALKAAYPAPLYWGAFICQGDPGPIGTD